jgi:hypothetical protein
MVRLRVRGRLAEREVSLWTRGTGRHSGTRTGSTRFSVLCLPVSGIIFNLTFEYGEWTTDHGAEHHRVRRRRSVIGMYNVVFSQGYHTPCHRHRACTQAVAEFHQYYARLNFSSVNTYGALRLLAHTSLALFLLHLSGLRVGRTLDSALDSTSTSWNGRHSTSDNEAEHAAPRMRAMPQGTSVPTAVSSIYFPQLGFICHRPKSTIVQNRPSS